MDNLSNFISNLNNNQAVLKLESFTLKTKLILNILYFLQTKGYIKSYFVGETLVKIDYKYLNNKRVLTKIVRMSKGSKRIFVKYQDIQKLCTKHTDIVLSTRLGIYSGKDIVNNNLQLGGEFLFIIR